MITATGQDQSGQDTVFLFLTDPELGRLRKGECLLVPAERLRKMGFPDARQIIVSYTADTALLCAALEDSSPGVRTFTEGKVP